MCSAKARHSQEEEAHALQIEGLQMVLFSLEALGTKSAFLQMEFDGVVRYIAATEISQMEFDGLMKKAVKELATPRASREAAAAVSP